MDAARAIDGAARAAWMVVNQNRWRSALTLTICGIGTAGVIVAGAIGNAQVIDMQRRLDAVGGRLVVVSPNTVPPYPGRSRQIEHFISLEPSDASALRDAIPELQAVVPVIARNSTLRLGHNASRIRLLGTVAAYAPVRGFTIAKGRFLAGNDEGQRVIVLGNAASRELDPEGARLGAVVWLGGQPYEVIGILRPLGVNFAGEDEDHQAFIPLDTYRHRVANRWWLSYLYLQVAADADSANTLREVVKVLRARQSRFGDQVDDVIVRDMAEVAAQQSALSATAVWVVSLTSGLLLVLGMVGIATLMIQTVRQRRGEIGLRRAVGATPFDVAVQLFMEAMGLASLGVLGGLIVGMAGSLAGQWLWEAFVTVDTGLLLATVSSSLVVSGLAGLVPALIAARIEPAAALRL
jgi:putative ABC transport system permease protein